VRTKKEIEAAMSEEINRFEQDYMNRVSKDIHVCLSDDLILIRLRGILSPAEEQLVKSLPVEKGRDLVKLTRCHLLETTRPVMEAIVEKVVGVKLLSVHHDISTVTGERIIVFTLVKSPDCGEAKLE